ncbi:hypothetical protein N7465_006353 [Penicillium sp. CMV-2018d]|nr:hypothetical protein N7465_006353 [Penicillium sp. CMV-2018d]
MRRKSIVEFVNIARAATAARESQSTNGSLTKNTVKSGNVPAVAAQQHNEARGMLILLYVRGGFAATAGRTSRGRNAKITGNIAPLESVWAADNICQRKLSSCIIAVFGSVPDVKRIICHWQKRPNTLRHAISTLVPPAIRAKFLTMSLKTTKEHASTAGAPVATRCDELPQHLLTCKIAICDICKRRFATAAALREHQTAGCLAQPQQPSSDSHGLSLGIWKSNRPRGFSLSIWKSKAPNNLSEGHSLDWLSANFPLTPGVHRVLKTWVDSPNTVAIGDFEYSVHFAKILKHQAVVEFSLANAKGEWIVPRTTINHGMAKGRYAALMRFTYDERRESNPALYGAEFGRAMMMIRKFYGQGDWTEETPGLTWAQIAQIIEEYIKKHGPLDLFLEWGTNNGDYQCLRDGLESVGKAHLLPPKPKWAERPYAWWSALRRRLGYSAADAPLGLGILYRAIFPEDAELANGWHNSDVDTMMTIKLIETYFIRALDQPIPGKIDSYFRPILPEDVESRLEDLNINECDDDEERCNEMFYQEMRDLDDELCKEEGEEGEQSEADEEADEEMTEDEGTDIEEEMSDREETS